jgi:hypothetical protein
VSKRAALLAHSGRVANGNAFALLVLHEIKYVFLVCYIVLLRRMVQIATPGARRNNAVQRKEVVF